MHIVQITPGAGGMYCGNCFRDNTLVSQWRQQGHQTLMVPLYLPLTLEESDQSAGTRVFFGGINVYLDQQSNFFRHSPDWLRHWLDSPSLLRWAAGRAAKTRPEDVGELTISMLRGEDGNQARELDDLIAWLQSQQHPDVICLSNALLIGLARKLKNTLHSRIVCNLQGEDYFLDAMPEPHRRIAWQTLASRIPDVDLFIAPSRYFGDLMARRLAIPPQRLHVVHNGIGLEGFNESPVPSPPSPTLGFFARTCKEKGLDLLIDAFLLLKQRPTARDLKLRVGGGCGPGDEPFVDQLKQKLRHAGVLNNTEFHLNIDRTAKIAFLQSLSVFSVPATYGEAFGLYLLEALAAGVPAVQPRTASFPELIEATGGGILCEPNNPTALADAIESLLTDPARARALGQTGQRAVRRDFTSRRMATDIIAIFETLLAQQPSTLNPQLA
jgi:glycosyltransferase involved in cell wall biosynthesis